MMDGNPLAMALSGYLKQRHMTLWLVPAWAIFLISLHIKLSRSINRGVSFSDHNKSRMSDKVTLGYWGIRGLAQVARLLLAYTGAVWEDVKYAEREQWFEKDKKELGLPFANLPYLIDGSFKLTESKAIYQYIINRSGKTELLGKTIQEKALVESLLGVIGDLRTPTSPLFWDKEWESKLPAALEKIAPKIEELAKFYGEKEFALGYLTLVDFQLNEFGYYVEKIAPQVYAKYEFMGRLRTAFENLPEIKKYYQQESATKGPFIPPFAAIPF